MKESLQFAEGIASALLLGSEERKLEAANPGGHESAS
jgi:hypothetical protein